MYEVRLYLDAHIPFSSVLRALSDRTLLGDVMLDFLDTLFNFMSKVGGFLAFVLIALMAYKFWYEADAEKEEVDE